MEIKNISIPNSITRAKVHPALKALHAILSVVASDYHIITYSFLSNFLKEKRTATETKLKELNELQHLMNRSGSSFTLISNEILLSDKLSLASKGLYMMIKSFATFHGFVITKDYFYKISGMSFKTFDKAWKELIKADLLLMQQHRTYNGQFIYTYNLTELATASNQEVQEPEESPEITPTQITALADAAARHRKAHCNYSKRACDHNQNRRTYSHYETEIRQKNNYTQREYDDEFLNSLFVDLTASSVAKTALPKS